MRTLSLIVVALALMPAGVVAQVPIGDPERAPARLGPVGITPSMTISSLIDSNVFREAGEPRRDVSITVSPGVRGWLRLGRSRLAVDGRGDFVYFRRYSGEGSLDGTIAGQWEIPINRITPWVEGGLVRGRQRIGYDIDARAERQDTSRGGGLRVRTWGRTDVLAFMRSVEHRFGADSSVIGADLQESLNRRATTLGVAVSHELTPVTAVVVEAESIRDRFTRSPARDSNSRRLVAGLDLNGLISGRARLGYRTFTPLGAISPFRGVIGSLDGGVTIVDRVRLSGAAHRDLEYSYDLASPHYLRSGGQLTLAWRLTGHWEVQGRLGRQHLTYYDTAGAVARIDRIDLDGGGVDYRIGSRLRAGATIEWERRLTARQGRSFDGYRTGLRLIYGG